MPTRFKPAKALPGRHEKDVGRMTAYQSQYLVERFALSLDQAQAFISEYGVERNELVRRVQEALGARQSAGS